MFLHTESLTRSPVFSFVLNRQPGKALPFYLRLRRPNVFDLIREFNLFTAVRDQALLLVEFDMELNEKIAVVAEGSAKPTPRGTEGMAVDGDRTGTGKHGKAIQLLVDHSHSIPVRFRRLSWIKCAYDCH